jgi:serine/threonine protein kinase
MEDAQGALTTTPTAEPSARTDRLELVQQLSAGSVGSVHKARNPKLNRTVALRQVQVPEWLDDVDDLIKRILAEARAGSALDHPNIARLYTGGYKGFTIFLTAEFVEGTNIREFAANRNLGVAEIIALGKQLCAAMEYAHQKNVLHNALTPANLKVLPDGNLKVLDFGLLREKHLYSPTPAKRLENEHYLSPEQLKNKPVSQATNIFSAATILYELLTTRNPFAGKHLGEVDRNITEIDASPASLSHSRVSEAISKVLMKGLAKHPLARFQNFAEFATALNEALRSAPGKASSSVVAVAPPPRPAAPAPAPKPSSSNGYSAPVKPAPVPASNGQSTPLPAARVSSNESSLPAPAPKSVAPVKAVSAVVARAESAPAAPPSKMPVKMLGQWKLVGGIAAALFVVLAVAISLNHRSKVAPPAPEVAVQAPEAPQVQPVATVPQTPQALDTQPSADVREPQARRSKEKIVKAGPAPASAPVTDGQLAVSSEPEGAIFFIEGKTTDSWKTPQVVGSLAPAVYKVTVSKNGYSTETRNIQVVSGNRVSLDVRLTALKGTLSIGGTPVGARIVLDGKETGRFSPAEFTLDPAVHTISLHKEGFFDNTGEIKLSAGQTLNYSPSLTPAGRTDNIKMVGGIKKLFGGGSSAGMVRMEIKSDPKGAQISINGTVLSKVTPVEIQVEPGNYDITLQKDGYKPVHKMVTTQANDKVKIEEQLSK